MEFVQYLWLKIRHIVHNYYDIMLGISLFECVWFINGCWFLPKHIFSVCLFQIYRRHFCDILHFKFPRCFLASVKAVLTGSDNGVISAACWYDLLKCIQNSDENTDTNSGCVQTNLTLTQVLKYFIVPHINVIYFSCKRLLIGLVPTLLHNATRTPPCTALIQTILSH